MSNKNIIIAVVVVIVLALVGGGIYLNSTKGKSADLINNVREGVQNAGESMTKGSIKGLLGTGKNVMCVIDSGAGGASTVYVSGNNMRGDFTTVAGSTTTKSHMVQDGDYAYIWTDGATEGSKMNIKAMQESAGNASSSGQSAQDVTADIDREVDMKCSAWNVDNSKFEVPTNVTFTDLSAMMEKMAPGAGGNAAPKMDSSYCNAIPDAQAKADCISALSGN